MDIIGTIHRIWSLHLFFFAVADRSDLTTKFSLQREKYNKEVEIPDPKDKTKTKTVTATRTTEQVSSFEIEKYTEDYEKFVIAKYFNDTFAFKKE